MKSVKIFGGILKLTLYLHEIKTAMSQSFISKVFCVCGTGAKDSSFVFVI